MNCEECENNILDYLGKRGTEEIHIQVKKHLQECKQCRAKFEELEGIEQVGQLWNFAEELEPEKVPEQFIERVVTDARKLLSEGREKWWHSYLAFFQRRIVLMPSTIAVTLLVVFFIQSIQTTDPYIVHSDPYYRLILQIKGYSEKSYEIPADMKVSKFDDKTIQFEWNKIEGVESYTFQLFELDEENPLIVENTTSNRYLYSLNRLKEGIEYRWTISDSNDLFKGESRFIHFGRFGKVFHWLRK